MKQNTEKKYTNIIINAVGTLLKRNPCYEGIYSLSAIYMIEELIKDSKEKDLEYRALNFLRQELSNEGLNEINFDEIYENA